MEAPSNKLLTTAFEASLESAAVTLLTDFETSNQGVYLSREGQNIFLQMYEEKLKSRITIKGKEMSYYQLLESEVQNYKNFLLTGETYTPYKYY